MLYSDHFFPTIGGSENYALDLANELTLKGNLVYVVTAEKSDKRDDFSFQISRINRPLKIVRINFNFLDIHRLVKEINPDVFHINYNTGGENILILLLRLMKVPIVLTYHADHMVPLGKAIDLIQSKTIFRLCDKIIVQTERDQKSMIYRGLPSAKIVHFKFNGVRKRYRKEKNYGEIVKADSKNFVCIGRLDNMHRYKGIGRMLELLSELKNLSKFDDLSLNIIGDGELKSYYEAKSVNLGLDSVRFLGNLDEEQLLTEISGSDVLILPSINKAEGFGRVALEALALGIPVLVSKYAGISVMVEKYGVGAIFDPSDFISFVKAVKEIKQIKNDRHFMKRLETMFLKEEIDISSTTDKTIDLYHSIIN